jgi:hypothetical protein
MNAPAKFKVGDKVFCNCSFDTCGRRYTLTSVEGFDLKGDDQHGKESSWIGRSDVEFLVLQDVYDSPLYKALN